MSERTLRLKAETVDRIQELAEKTEKTPSEIILDACKRLASK